MAIYVLGVPLNSWPMYSLLMNFLQIVFVFMIFIIAGGPLIQMIKSKLFGRTMLFIFRKDRKVVMLGGKYESGSIRTDKYGDYTVTPQTTYMLPNGLSIGVVYEPYGATLPENFIKSAEELRSLGNESYQQVEKHLLNEAANFTVQVDAKDADGNNIKETMSIMPQMAIYEKVISQKDWDDLDKMAEMDRQMVRNKLVDWLVEINFLKMLEDRRLEQMRNDKNPENYNIWLVAHQRYTAAVHAVVNFFRYNVNPQTTRMVINYNVANALANIVQKDWFKYTFMFIMLLMGAAIAYAIISGVGGGGGGGSGIPNFIDTGARVIAPETGANIG